MEEKETLIDKIGKVINFAGSIVLMNMLFVVACIPIVTIGPAWTGLATALRYNIRGDSWFQGFQFGFKTRFWRSMLCWIPLAAAGMYFLDDVNYAVSNLLPLFEQGFEAVVSSGFFVSGIAAALMFLLVAMLTVSFLILNVYIPTGVGRWVENAVNMVFKAPLQLLVCGILFWLPVILVVFLTQYIILGVLVFVGAYFAIAVLMSTFLLKMTLMDYLIDARKEGILLAEEGRVVYGSSTDEDEEDEEYEEDEEEPVDTTGDKED